MEGSTQVAVEVRLGTATTAMGPRQYNADAERGGLTP
jgi:hypothetical protein